MSNKYFGTDGIRGTVNQGNITGEKFFKFGLAAATYFKNQKKTSTARLSQKRLELWTSLSKMIGLVFFTAPTLGPTTYYLLH